MNERDIRNAFHNLKDDVMYNVQTEDRLEQITRRRTRVRPALVAFAGAAAVVLIIGAAVLSFRPTSETDPASPANGGPTTVADPTTAPTNAAPSASLPELRPGMVVVADPTLSAGEPSDGRVEWVVVDPATVAFDVDLAVGDGDGGVFVQVGNTIAWVRRDPPATNLFNGSELYEDEVDLRLQDVALVNGEVNVIFVAAGGVDEQRYEEVWRYEVSTGAPYPIYRIDAWESTIQRVSLQNDTMVVTVAEEGTTYFVFLDGDGQPIDVDAPLQAVRGTDFFDPIVGGVLSPDGARLAYVQIQDVTTAEEGYVFADVVVWDLVGGVELQRLELELREGEFAPMLGRLDYDGVGIVLGRSLNFIDGEVPLPPLRIESLDDATITDLATAGTPSLIE
jgi:hypothetical protein